jgi:hypothetical protein
LGETSAKLELMEKKDKQLKEEMLKRKQARKQKQLEEQYKKQRAEMGMPDPDDYKSHNSSDDESSP